MNVEFSKRLLWRYVNKKLRKVVHTYHVFAILSILIEELILDLKNDKEIKIFNFSKIYLHKTKPRKYFDVRYQKIMESQGSKIIKIELSKKLKNKLVKYLHIDES